MKTQDWEKEFDELWEKDFLQVDWQVGTILDNSKYKAFITQLLKDQRAELAKKFYELYMKQHGEKLKAWNLIKDDLDAVLELLEVTKTKQK